MLPLRPTIASAAAFVLLVGFGVIGYYGRPTAAIAPDAWNIEDVGEHATKEDCWTTINGSVYDLTSWVAVHPGGPAKIIGLCGRDGTDAFVKKHSDSSKAQAALILLKIGSLK